MMKRSIIVLVTILLSSIALKAQISLDIKLPSKVLIKGTSTLHDWESKVEKTEAKIVFDNYENVTIEKLFVTVDVFSIKSGKKTMDKLTYKALKGKEFPKITFLFKEGDIVNQNSEFINIKLKGDLTIAGVTKEVSVLTKVNKKGEKISLTGSYKLKMTSFGVKPPTALLGTIKTGDEITIDFGLNF